MITKLFAIALAAVLGLYTGTATTDVIGTHESQDNLVLNVNDNGGVKSVSLSGYAVLEWKDVSITAKLTTDAKGNITAFEDVVVKGAPAKVKTVTGVLSDSKADITLKGKAAGVFNFQVVYKASRTK